MRAERATPLRVLVKGASASVLTSWMGGPRSDLAYPRALEAALLAAGQPATVRVDALPADRTTAAFRHWDRAVLPWSPDVVVLHYGQADGVHLFVPRWLERHANSPWSRPGPVRERYRRWVLRPAWKGLAQLQVRVDAAFDSSRLRRRYLRVGAHLERLIQQTRSVGSPLILIPTLLPPGPPWQAWFPGCAVRMQKVNAAFDAVVQQIDHPDVRRFPIEEVVATMRLDVPTPDGGHFTPELHGEIARALAEVVLTWLAGQPRLERP